MTKRIVFIITLAAAAVLVGGVFQQASAKQSRKLLQVGTFDSRAVACAWLRSDEHMQKVRDMKAEYNKAKASGDKKRMAELEKEGPQSQDLAHKQVFSNEPIEDVLKRIEKNLPKIAESAGVDILVSKWEIAYQKKSAEFVDVTWEMANLFGPDEETVKVIKEIIKAKPIPVEELKHDH